MKLKNWLRRGASALLAMAVVLTALPPVPAAAIDERQGLLFESAAQRYAATESEIEIPNTAEVWVKLDEGNRRQIIMNNYQNGGESSWGLEVNDDNTLRYWERVDGEQISCKFSSGENKIDLGTGEWMLVSVVRDRTNKQVLAYVNGELAGTLSTGSKAFHDAAMTNPLYFGTDLRKGYWLDGEISEVRLWSTERTAAEIKETSTAVLTGSESGLAHAWDFSNGGSAVYADTVLPDLAAAGGVDVLTPGFPLSFTEPTEPTTEAFSVNFNEIDKTGVWTNQDGTTFSTATLVEDGGSKVLKLSGLTQNKPVFLTGLEGETVPYLKNAVYEVRAKVSGVENPVFGAAFRGSMQGERANWVNLRGAAQNGDILAQTSAQDWLDPWTDTKWELAGDTWYTFRLQYIGKTVSVQVKSDTDGDWTTLVDGSNDTIWEDWLTEAGYLGFCGWGDAQEYYISSITAEPVDGSSVQHAVTFDLLGGTMSGADPQTVTDAGKVTTPVGTPERAGFTFNGWYRDSAGTKPWNFETDTVWKDTTIYAGWLYQYQSAGFEGLTGVSFDGPADQLATKDKLSAAPLSFEATVKLPHNLEGRGGVIIGNYMNAGYYDYDLGYVGLEVYSNGNPRLYWQQGRRNQPGDGTQSVVIPNVDLRQDEWVHLAMTFDADADEVKCYINGALVSTVQDCAFQPVIPAQALKIGGDYRGTGGTVESSGYNTQYFKGEIANVSVWSNVRNAESIASDVAVLKSDKTVPSTGDGLLASWSFAAADSDLYPDLSGSHNDVANFVDWIDPGFSEGDYTMVALPDTQFLSQNYPDKYEALTQWIVDNEKTYNIQAVMHMGDMVNTGNDTQWSACKTAMDILDTTDIPWMPMRGNHDPSEGFNNTFPYQEFAQRSYFGGSYDKDKLDQTYWNVTVGDREYLILSLGWAPTQGAIDWAKTVIEANPKINIILTTHAFMYWDGTHLNDEDLDYTSAYLAEGMDGSAIWEQLGSQYPNVVLGMGGHIGFPDVIERTDQNGAGKTVSSLLCDAQGIDYTYGLGMMMMLTFHKNSDTVDINWYSTAEGKLFRTRNQFSISVPHVSTQSGGGSGGSSGSGSSGGGSSSSGSGKPSVSTGGTGGKIVAGSGTATITPDTGYKIKTVTVNGKEIAVPENGKLTGLKSTDKVVVTFEKTAEQETPPDRPSQNFGDVKNHWAASAIDFVLEKKLFTGVSTDEFAPDAPMTRAMLMTVLARADGQDTTGGAAWYEAGMNWARNKGVSDGTNPGGDITREQLVAMLYRYAGSPQVTGTETGNFTDETAIANYAASAMLWAVQQGIITGKTEKTLDPQGFATRAEVAAMLQRLLSK